MTTSGSTDYNLTARGIITFALEELRAIGAGETFTAEDGVTAQRALNLMLKSWQKYENLWRLTEGSLTPTASTAAVTISTVPHRVTSARYYDGTNETPLELMTRDEYYDLPLKTTAGSPNSFYVDYQRAAATMYIWPVITTIGTKRIKYTYQRKFEDIDALDDDLDVRQEWLETVGYNLAVRLAPKFAKIGSQQFQGTDRQATELLETLQDDDREDFVQFVPCAA